MTEISGYRCYPVTAGFEVVLVANLAKQLALAYKLAKMPSKLSSPEKHTKNKNYTQLSITRHYLDTCATYLDTGATYFALVQRPNRLVLTLRMLPLMDGHMIPSGLPNLI